MSLRIRIILTTTKQEGGAYITGKRSVGTRTGKVENDRQFGAITGINPASAETDFGGSAKIGVCLGRLWAGVRSTTYMTARTGRVVGRLYTRRGTYRGHVTGDRQTDRRTDPMMTTYSSG